MRNLMIGGSAILAGLVGAACLYMASGGKLHQSRPTFPPAMRVTSKPPSAPTHTHPSYPRPNTPSYPTPDYSTPHSSSPYTYMQDDERVLREINQYAIAAKNLYDRQQYTDSLQQIDAAVRAADGLRTADVRFGAQVRLYRLQALIASGAKQYSKASGAFEKAVGIDQLMQELTATDYNNYAWLLATCPDASVRNGTKAVEMAKIACDKSGNQKAYILDTLAAACAEAGQFSEAVKWQQEAIRLDGGQSGVDYQSRLALYQSNQPYREE